MIKKDIHIEHYFFWSEKCCCIFYHMLMIFLLKICELIFNFVNPVIE